MPEISLLTCIIFLEGEDTGFMSFQATSPPRIGEEIWATDYREAGKRVRKHLQVMNVVWSYTRDSMRQTLAHTSFLSVELHCREIAT